MEIRIAFFPRQKDMATRENFRFSFRENLIQPVKIDETTREKLLPPVKNEEKLHKMKLISIREKI